MSSSRRSPSNWVLESLGGNIIKGFNIVTKEDFIGTMDQFNAMLSEAFVTEGLYSDSLIKYNDGVQTAVDTLKQYTASVAVGHYFSFTRAANGQAIVALTADPRYVDTLSYLDFIKPTKPPSAVEAEISISGRCASAYTGFIWGNFQDENFPEIPDIAVTQWWCDNSDGLTNYSTSIGPFLKIKVNGTLDSRVSAGDWVSIINANNAGVANPSINLQNAAIRHISSSRNMIVVSFNDEAVIASQDIGTSNPTTNTMFLRFFDNMLNARHGMGLRFSGSTPTSNAFFTRNGLQSEKSGIPSGDQRIVSGSTAPATSASVYGYSNLKASSRFRLENRADDACFYDSVANSPGGKLMMARAVCTAVKPDSMVELYPRFYLKVPPNTTKPVAIISAISKSGTTTATVTTDAPHGLSADDLIVIAGVRDNTNFARTSVPASVTVIDSVTFSFAHGSAATASSYGGTVHKCFAGQAQQNLIASTIQNVDYSSSSQRLLLTISPTASSLTVGDHVVILGTRQSASATGVDGIWVVHRNSGSNVELVPFFDINGIRVSPNPSVINVAAGGTIILPLSLRIHDLLVEEWTEHRTAFDGQGTTRLDKAVPVNIINSAQINALDGTGALPVRGGVIGIPDVVATTATSSNTSSTILNDLGNGFQVTVAVTSVSGTLPTFDYKIEESLDRGVNWHTLYDFQRITANGVFHSPILQASGQNIRYKRTITGTTPSFTYDVTRNILPFAPVNAQRGLVDRTIVPNTLSSTTAALFTGEASRHQMIVNMGAITTTAPVFQMQGSDDNLNFYDIGATLTAVANSTVQLTVYELPCKFTRVIVKTAGVASTLGYIALKAWS